MKNSKRHKRIKPEQDYDALTNNTITKMELTLDKLKDVCAINTEAGRDNPA